MDEDHRSPAAIAARMRDKAAEIGAALPTMRSLGDALDGMSKEVLARFEAAMDLQIGNGALLRAFRMQLGVANRAKLTGEEAILFAVQAMLRVNASEAARVLSDRAKSVREEVLRREGEARGLDAQANAIVREAETRRELPKAEDQS